MIYNILSEQKVSYLPENVSNLAIRKEFERREGAKAGSADYVIPVRPANLF